VIGLGWSLWRQQHSAATEPTIPEAAVTLDPAGAR
jgi:hypothetical protein